MAASLAVEWAKDGVRVNALRYGPIPLGAGSWTFIYTWSFSPGYMATKLTKTILEKDSELKVRNIPRLLSKQIINT